MQKKGTIEQSVRISFTTTNNVAKYKVVLLTLKYVIIHSDSLLMVNQVNGTFENKEEKMNRYLMEIKEWAIEFKAFRNTQILCISNAHVDALATLSSIVPTNMKRIMHVSTITEPSVKE